MGRYNTRNARDNAEFHAKRDLTVTPETRAVSGVIYPERNAMGVEPPSTAATVTTLTDDEKRAAYAALPQPLPPNNRPKGYA